MALSDKDILITTNKGQTDDPKIEFKGADADTGAQTISLNVYPTSNGALSFEGSAGQLFSITNDLTGTIFSVNDISGIPSIEVLDDGTVKLAEFGGEVQIGGDLLVRGVIKNYTGEFTWDSATASPDAVNGRTQVVTDIHRQMRGCVLNTDGSVNYYLDEFDWSKKADGTASTLTGADGNVMVEIPKFWYQVIYVTTKPTRRISSVPASGFKLHPAFIKDGVEVDYRYYGAYDACVYDVSESEYISGLNYDNNDGANGVGVDVTASTGDKLASVKGISPMTGLTRDEYRTLAKNVGAGWRQLDFMLWSAVQMLYLIEYQSFYSQDILGAGNTNSSYLASSGNQTDSPHTIAGAGDSLGNGSTDTTSGAGVSAKPGTSFMKYRGIENFYGNIWNWADGINVNVGGTGNVHMTNNAANWADNTATNYDLITDSLSTSTGNNYISELLPADPYFLASEVSGSSSTYMTDLHYGSASSNRAVLVGGGAAEGALAGVFCLISFFDSSIGYRSVGGGRLAY